MSRPEGNSASQTQEGSRAHELTEVVTACTRPCKLKPVQIPALKGEVGFEEPLAMDSLLGEGKSVFFKCVIPGRLTML